MTDIVSFIRSHLDAEEQMALAASADRGSRTPTGENWRWECGNCDTVIDITPVTLLDEVLECPACERIGVALRSVEEYPTNSVGPLPHFVVSGEEVRPVDGLYLTHFDPARALRDVAAKRAIVALHASDGGHECPAGQDPWGSRTVYQQACPTLRALASKWADMPGWDPEWSVE